MKIKFTDSKQYNIIFKDALNEDQYEKLANNAYKGKELAEFYELPSDKLKDIFDASYSELGYPLDDTWFIHPSVLEDNARMEKLYKVIRTKVLNLLNDDIENNDLYQELIYDDYKTLKDLFKIRYAFKDRSYVVDWNIFEEIEEEDETSKNKEPEKEDEEDARLLNATCQEYLEEFENKIDKKDPKWYLIQMALNKDKNWAYIKKADELMGDPELDIVTPKRAKKMMQELS